jgi:hypothetical protein
MGPLETAVGVSHAVVPSAAPTCKTGTASVLPETFDFLGFKHYCGTRRDAHSRSGLPNRADGPRQQFATPGGRQFLASEPPVEPVSVGHRTRLGSRRQFLPGKGLASPETGPVFLATNAYRVVQRLGLSWASPAKAPGS